MKRVLTDARGVRTGKKQDKGGKQKLFISLAILGKSAYVHKYESPKIQRSANRWRLLLTASFCHSLILPFSHSPHSWGLVSGIGIGIGVGIPCDVTPLLRSPWLRNKPKMANDAFSHLSLQRNAKLRPHRESGSTVDNVRGGSLWLATHDRRLRVCPWSIVCGPGLTEADTLYSHIYQAVQSLEPRVIIRKVCIARWTGLVCLSDTRLANWRVRLHVA